MLTLTNKASVRTEASSHTFASQYVKNIYEKKNEQCHGMMTLTKLKVLCGSNKKLRLKIKICTDQ